MTKTKTTPTKKATTDTSTRHQRNMVRATRALKGAELKAFVVKHREDFKAVAAETNRKKLSVEASKLLGMK